MSQSSDPVTEIDILPISVDFKLDDGSSKEGKTWNDILNIIKSSGGYQGLYWGRQVETPGNVQLHTGNHIFNAHFKTAELTARQFGIHFNIISILKLLHHT